MKFIPFFLAALTGTALASQPVPGDVSSPQTFAASANGGFEARSLANYDGSILVIMLMTPWCPTCNSQTAAVGQGVLNYFNNSSRGSLQGKNDNGIPVRSIVLSTEPFGFDSTMASIARSNGYDEWGLDANTSRQNPRVLLGYYRGGFINSSNLYDWGEDRRRVVILSMVQGANGKEYREILFNQNSYDSSNNAFARAQINSINTAEPALTFAAWAGGHAFPAELDGPNDDPDLDASTNVWEFFHGTDPMNSQSRDPGPSLTFMDGVATLHYRRAAGISGFDLTHRQSPDLVTWTDLPELAPVVDEQDGIQHTSATLPSTPQGTNFYRLEITIP